MFENTQKIKVYPYPSINPTERNLKFSTINDVTQYWKTYISLGYFVQIVPFRLVRNGTTGEYDYNTNILQKYFCLFMTTTSAVVVLGYGLVSFFEADIRAGFLLYVQIGNFISFLIYYWAVWLIFWKKSEQIKKLICAIEQNSLICSKFSGIGTKTAWSAFACVGFSFSITTFSLWTQHWKRLSGETKIICQIFENSEYYLPCAWTYRILYIYQYYLMHYCDLFVAITSLFFQNIIKNFLTSAKDLYRGQIFEEFIRLKNLVHGINEIIGPFILIITVAYLPFYAQTIGSILYRPELLRKPREPRILIYLTYNFTMLLIAGNATKKIHGIKNIFYRQSINHQKFSHPNPNDAAEISLILNELNSNAISLSAYGIFNVTTGVIGSICGTLLTYGFLIAQLKSAN